MEKKIYKVGDKIIFDNRFSLRHHLMQMEGIVESIVGPDFFVKTKYGVVLVSPNEIVEENE